MSTVQSLFPLQAAQTMGSTSGCPRSGAAVTPLIRHLRNPVGVIQANLRDQASGFSGQPGGSRHVWSARPGNACSLREKHHSMARFQGAQKEPERHGGSLVERNHAMLPHDTAIPGQRPSPERVAGVIGIDGEEIAAVAAHLMQVAGNDQTVQ